MILLRKILASVGFLLIALVYWTLLNLDTVSRGISDRVPANAAIPSERQMPTTAAAFAFSSADVQVMGGRGEGLSCSLPWALEVLAFPPQQGCDAIGLEMRQACVTHDYCYREMDCVPLSGVAGFHSHR